jgi:hypothetical protein
MNNCASYNTQNRHVLHFQFVRDLTTIFLIGGLGIENKSNGLRQVSTVLCVISFSGAGPK